MKRFYNIITYLFLALANVVNAESFQVRNNVVVIDDAQENAYLANELVGAVKFYENGIYGQGANVANVELGLLWSDHYSFADATIGELYVLEGVDPTTLIDGHATGVAGVIAGCNSDTTNEFGFYASFGIAPRATISSGAIAREINPDGTAKDLPEDFMAVYKHFFETNQQDVINSSWGNNSTEPDGFLNSYVDSLIAKNTKITLVISAGNEGVDENGNEVKNSVSSFAQSYNAITVGALGNMPAYDKIADFSSRSPSDFFNPYTGEVVKNVRAAIDIVSIGENVVIPYYDASNPTETGAAVIANGTSFSAPMVAGVASLMVSLSKQLEADESAVAAGWSANARDTRVIRAVLLNSATKPTDWSNGQEVKNNLIVSTGDGQIKSFDNVIVTNQGLDFTYGAGILNADAAYDQYIMNNDSAWALSSLSFNTADFYKIGGFSVGDVLTATLVWLVQGNVENVPDENGRYEITDAFFSDLSLAIWIKDENDEYCPIAISDTKYNNVEHLSITLAAEAEYYASVGFSNMAYGECSEETYALAWSIATVPEASSFASIMAVAVLIFAIHRKRVV